MRLTETATDMPRPMWNVPGRDHNRDRDFEPWALKNLKELYLEINRLPSLENLEIDDCGSLLPFPVSCLPASVKSLEYYKCCSLNLESESLQGGSL